MSQEIPNELNLSKEVLARRVYSDRMYEYVCTMSLLAGLGPYVDKNKTAVDVGAAAGLMTKYFSEHAHDVVSFEAVPPVYEQTKKMEALGNVEAYNYAVGDCSVHGKMVDIYVDDKRLSNSGFQDLVDGQKIQVEAICLDQFLGAVDVDTVRTIGFIKIDVEGTELSVLHGTENIIRSHRPNFMVEIYQPYAADPLDSIFSLMMEEYGYKCSYYDRESGKMVQVADVDEGVHAVMFYHRKHDGDFLFYE